MSYLFKKDFNSLRHFSFNQLLMELSVSNSFLLDCCLSIAVPTDQIFSDKKSKQDLIVRLGMVYSILMSYRFGELSRLQRVMSAILMDEHVHEKVNVNVFHLCFCLYPTKLFVCFYLFFNFNPCMQPKIEHLMKNKHFVEILKKYIWTMILLFNVHSEYTHNF